MFCGPPAVRPAPSTYCASPGDSQQAKEDWELVATYLSSTYLLFLQDANLHVVHQQKREIPYIVMY